MRRHRKPGDVWTVLRGRVYDMSEYVDYHPGGEQMAMAAAGKDCARPGAIGGRQPWPTFFGGEGGQTRAALLMLKLARIYFYISRSLVPV